MVIYTNSKYAIGCYTKYKKKWLIQSWRCAQGFSRDNDDILINILEKLRQREAVGVKTDFEWVKGHSGVFGNEQADKLATAGASKVL
ncbi:hypothetical protein P171DRAFT_394509 [Karstenula rhodostoma CBS 690.94]|uniref:RNase H type-1 domain-containing protein n=1 Tax=Karstenula rhodostoma CBS 690.94 TaxID=1392251 RepID=A0A9P4PBN6_9PLEO|nr:hypothetical protein P171DRAFT_394509 [Karstenula rhodostoma CBS 690.94]